MKKQIAQVYFEGQLEPYYINSERDFIQLYQPVLVHDLDPWNLTIPYRDWPLSYNIGPGIYLAFVSALFYLLAALAMSADDLALVVRRWVVRKKKVAQLKRNQKLEFEGRPVTREPANQIPKAFL